MGTLYLLARKDFFLIFAWMKKLRGALSGEKQAA